MTAADQVLTAVGREEFLWIATVFDVRTTLSEIPEGILSRLCLGTYYPSGLRPGSKQYDRHCRLDLCLPHGQQGAEGQGWVHGHPLPKGAGPRRGDQERRQALVFASPLGPSPLCVDHRGGWGPDQDREDSRAGLFLIYHPGSRLLSYYAHLKDVRVCVGERVSGGGKIATLGRTGKNACLNRSPNLYSYGRPP